MYTTDGHVYVGPDFQKVVPESLLPRQVKKLYMYQDWCVALQSEYISLIHLKSERCFRSENRLDEVGLCAISAAPKSYGMFGLAEIGHGRGPSVLEFVEIIFRLESDLRFPEVLNFLEARDEHVTFRLHLECRPELRCPVPNSKFLEFRKVGGLVTSVEAEDARVCIQEEPYVVIDDEVFLLDSKRRVVFTNKFLE